MHHVGEIPSDMVSECPVGQKYSRGQYEWLPPKRRVLHSRTSRQWIMSDFLAVSPDSAGNSYILVVYNPFTRLIHLFPTQNTDAMTTARCLLVYFATYGMVDIFHSDPGSNYTAEVFRLLLQWLGVHQSLTLVNNPQADGVEPMNREILYRLRVLCADKRLKHQWSDPVILSWVQFFLNNKVDPIRGFSPFNLTFGTRSNGYFELKSAEGLSRSKERLEELVDDILHIQKVATEKLETYYTRVMMESPSIAANMFQTGDFVFKVVDKYSKPSKLDSRRMGPYEVVSHKQDSNTVSIKSMINGVVSEVNQSTLFPFFGSREDAFALACLDDNQVSIRSISEHKGDWSDRASLEFLVEFVDGDKSWLKFTSDISSTKAFETYCNARHPMYLLLGTKKDEQALMRSMRKTFDHQLEGVKGYVELRAWYSVFVGLEDKLPQLFAKRYVVEALVTRVSASKRDYTIRFPIFGHSITVNHWFMHTRFLPFAEDFVVLDGFPRAKLLALFPGKVPKLQ
jgi:hypothetical protein